MSPNEKRTRHAAERSFVALLLLALGGVVFGAIYLSFGGSVEGALAGVSAFAASVGAILASLSVGILRERPPEQSQQKVEQITIVRMPAATARDRMAVAVQTPSIYANDSKLVIGLWEDGGALVIGDPDMIGTPVRVTVTPARVP